MNNKKKTAGVSAIDALSDEHGFLWLTSSPSSPPVIEIA
jgi:hypothetical protein